MTCGLYNHVKHYIIDNKLMQQNICISILMSSFTRITMLARDNGLFLSVLKKVCHNDY